MPPQVSPTANASSSLTPYRLSVGAPGAPTSEASSYTAPSPQPPETLPTAVPSGPTSIDAPGGRGAERQVPTTVPTPTVSPACHQPTSSSRTSRIRHLPSGAVPRLVPGRRGTRGTGFFSRHEIVSGTGSVRHESPPV